MFSRKNEFPIFMIFFLPFMFDEIKSKQNLLKTRLKFGIRLSYFVKPCGVQLKRERDEREKRKKNNRKPLLLSLAGVRLRHSSRVSRIDRISLDV